MTSPTNGRLLGAGTVVVVAPADVCCLTCQPQVLLLLLLLLLRPATDVVAPHTLSGALMQLSGQVHQHTTDRCYFCCLPLTQVIDC